MKHFFYVLTLLLFPALTLAGPSSSGGGASIICRGPDNKIQSALLLDLYEGNIRHGLNIADSSETPQIQLLRAFNRLEKYDWYIASDVADALAAVESDIRFLPPGVIMAPGVDLGDSYAALIPDGCELAYVGYYEQDGTLRISRTIYEKLSNTDRAALFMHEALYKVARDVGHEKNSLAARTANAFLFSTLKNLKSADSAFARLRWTNDPTLNADGRTRFHTPAVVPAFQDDISILVKKFRNPGNEANGGISAFCKTSDGKKPRLDFGYGQVREGQRLTQHLPDCRIIYIGWGQMSDPTAQLEVFYGTYSVAEPQVEYRSHNPGYNFYSFGVAIPIYLDRKLSIPAWPL